MKVAIAGGGSVGTAIARDLCASGHEVLVLEQDTELVDRRRAEHEGVTWLAADACEVSSLDAAGLATADVVVAATGDDEDNLVVSLLAKQEFAVPRVVARVNNSKNQWLFNESWGVDVSVSTPHLLTALVEEAVSVGALVRLLQFQGGSANLVEVTLAEDSPAAGVAIADLSIPREATVVAVVRDDRLVVPRGDTVLQSGDEVLALVTADVESTVHALLIGSAVGTLPGPGTPGTPGSGGTDTYQPGTAGSMGG
ncbi:MAG: potassium channel family protein [Acidimicrobiales bacterium]